ncbi:SNF2-related domain-containing protein, partial [Reticulomyxa filosa]
WKLSNENCIFFFYYHFCEWTKKKKLQNNISVYLSFFFKKKKKKKELTEFKSGGFWKIDKIVNPNNRNPALEEDEDPSRYVRTKPPTIKPEGYFKLMSPHDFETELTLEFAHMLRDYMKDILKKREKIASYAKQKEKAMARIGKSMQDDIPSAIGGTPTVPAAQDNKAKGLTPFQQKKLQKQNTVASIAMPTTANDSSSDMSGPTSKAKTPSTTSATATATATAAAAKRKSMSNIPLDSVIPPSKNTKANTPRATTMNKQRRSVTNVNDVESLPNNNSKPAKGLSSKSHTVMDVTNVDNAKKKDNKEKRIQPKGKVEMPSKPVQGNLINISFPCCTKNLLHMHINIYKYIYLYICIRMCVYECNMHIIMHVCVCVCILEYIGRTRVANAYINPKTKIEEKKKEVPIVSFYEECGGQFEKHRIDGPKLLLQTRMTLANDLLVKNQHRPILMEFIDELKEDTSGENAQKRKSISRGPDNAGLGVSEASSPAPSRTSPAASASASPNVDSQQEFFAEEKEKERETWLIERQKIEEEKQKLAQEKRRMSEAQIDQELIDRAKEKLEEEKLQFEQEKIETAKQRLEIEKERVEFQSIQQERKELEALRSGVCIRTYTYKYIFMYMYVCCFVFLSKLFVSNLHITLHGICVSLNGKFPKAVERINGTTSNDFGPRAKKWEDQRYSSFFFFLLCDNTSWTWDTTFKNHREKERQLVEKELTHIAELRALLAKERREVELQRQSLQEETQHKKDQDDVSPLRFDSKKICLISTHMCNSQENTESDARHTSRTREPRKHAAPTSTAQTTEEPSQNTTKPLALIKGDADDEEHQQRLDTLEEERKQLEEDTKQLQNLRVELEKERARSSSRSRTANRKSPRNDLSSNEVTVATTLQTQTQTQTPLQIAEPLDVSSPHEHELGKDEIEPRFSRGQKSPSQPLPVLAPAKPLAAVSTPSKHQDTPTEARKYSIQFCCQALWSGQTPSTQVDVDELGGQLAQLWSGKGEVQNVIAKPLKKENGVELKFDVLVSVRTDQGEHPKDFISQFEGLLTDGTFAESVATGVNTNDKVFIKFSKLKTRCVCMHSFFFFALHFVKPFLHKKNPLFIFYQKISFVVFTIYSMIKSFFFNCVQNLTAHKKLQFESLSCYFN